MKRKRITVLTGSYADPVRKRVNGFIILPGLAIHKSPAPLLTSWNITHVRSGFSLVNNIKTKSEATRIAKEFLNKINWERAERHISKSILAHRACKLAQAEADE